MKIVPAVLSQNIDDYAMAYRLFEQMPGNEKVHIDIMDGKFVQTTSPEFEQILKIETPLKKQVHLMVENPIPYLELCKKYGVHEAIVHLDTDYGHIDNFINYDFEIYIGVNPENEFPEFGDLTFKSKGFLIMTVHPGLQGQSFLPEQLKKTTFLRNKGFSRKIIVDGSVNIETINLVKEYIIDEAIVGSGIIKQPDPITAYNQLTSLLKDN